MPDIVPYSLTWQEGQVSENVIVREGQKQNMQAAPKTCFITKHLSSSTVHKKAIQL